MTLAHAPPGSEWEPIVVSFAPPMFCDDLRATCDEYRGACVAFVDDATEYRRDLLAILPNPDGNISVMTRVRRCGMRHTSHAATRLRLLKIRREGDSSRPYRIAA
jgi:hypothetical protein